MSVLTKEKPLIQQFPVDWNNAPKWAYFWAMDSTGTAYFYEEEPELNVDKGYFHSDYGYHERCPYKIPGWERSLQQRSRRSHPHAEMMMKYAEVAARRVDPWLEFEVRCGVKDWTRCGGFNGFHPDFEYRHIGEGNQ